MKNTLLTLTLLFCILHAARAQYSVDWGKYMNEPMPNSNFSNNEETEQLAVDVKNAATNEEYIYVTGKSFTRNDHETSCSQNELHYGAEDDFLAKYDKCGNLQWFRFLGTDDDDAKDECGDFGDCIAIDRDPITDSTYIYVAGYSYTNYDPGTCPTCAACGVGNSAKAFSCQGDTCVFQKTKKDAIDAFVAKYNENGKLLKWTYFGGMGDDNIIGITVFQHDVFITGTTTSPADFLPASTPKFDSTVSTQSDAFVAQLDGNLCKVKFFSYMGGPEYERSHAISCFKITGPPAQTEFYISGATSGYMGDTSYHELNSFGGGSDDSFIALWKLNKQTGIFKPQWVKYIGGAGNDRDRELVIDKSHNAIVTGFTQSPDLISNSSWSYPVSNFYDTSFNGAKDVFLAKIDLAGNGLWCTFFGGGESDLARGLVRYNLKAGGVTSYVAISGGTKSTDLPTQLLHPPFQPSLNGGSSTSRDAFVAIFTDPVSPSQVQKLEFSSYFGGAKNEWSEATIDYGPDLDIGANKVLYLTFYTQSEDIENCITSRAITITPIREMIMTASSQKFLIIQFPSNLTALHLIGALPTRANWKPKHLQS
jgi:hypothetical protein